RAGRIPGRPAARPGHDRPRPADVRGRPEGRPPPRLVLARRHGRPPADDRRPVRGVALPARPGARGPRGHPRHTAGPRRLHPGGALARVALARAEPPRDPPKDEPPPMPVIRPLVKAEKSLPRPFKYTLLPDPADVQPGNAAQTWLRAGRVAVTSHRQVFGKDTE